VAVKKHRDQPFGVDIFPRRIMWPCNVELFFYFFGHKQHLLGAFDKSDQAICALLLLLLSTSPGGFFFFFCVSVKMQFSLLLPLFLSM
jgi:hypothetical protein